MNRYYDTVTHMTVKDVTNRKTDYITFAAKELLLCILYLMKLEGRTEFRAKSRA